MKTVKIVVFGAFLFLVTLAMPVSAQQCGPGCPACSGKAIGNLLPRNTLLGTVLHIPDGEEETSVYNVRYGLFQWLDLGIGYAQDAKEVIWSVRVQPVSQDDEGWRPGLLLGTGSIQAQGTDQSVYAQLVKTWEVVEGKLGLSFAGGYATDWPDFDENWGLGTVSVILYDRICPFYTYDGINSHAGLSMYAAEWLTVTGYALEMEELAVMVGIQWAFGG